MTLLELIADVQRLGVSLSLTPEGQVKARGFIQNLSWEQKQALIKHKPDLVALLSGSGCVVQLRPGTAVRVYPARSSCLEAGCCQQLTKEADCSLFPLTWCWGYCISRPVLAVVNGTGSNKKAKKEATTIEQSYC